MDSQLRLLRVDPPPRPGAPAPDDWRLDDETIRTGKRGVALARAALRSSRADRRGGEDGERSRRRPGLPVPGHAA